MQLVKFPAGLVVHMFSVGQKKRCFSSGENESRARMKECCSADFNMTQFI